MEVQSTAVNRYLEQVSNALTGQDPQLRTEIVGSLSEHIDAALAELGPDPTSEQINQILRDLGDPLFVAGQAAATAGYVEQSGPAGSVSSAGSARPAIAPWRQQLTGVWVPPTVVLLISVGAALGMFVLPLFFVAAGVFLLIASPVWEPADKTRVVVIAVGASLGSLVLFLMLAMLSDSFLGFLIALAVLPVPLMAPAFLRGIRRARELNPSKRAGNPIAPIFTVALLGLLIPSTFMKLSVGMEVSEEFRLGAIPSFFLITIVPFILLGIIMIMFLPGWHSIERVLGMSSSALYVGSFFFVVWLQETRPLYARQRDAEPFLMPTVITVVATVVLIAIVVLGYRRSRQTLALTLPEC